MSLQPPMDDWLKALAQGDERAVAEFWQEYGERLNRLADKHLSPRLQRRQIQDAEPVHHGMRPMIGIHPQ